MRFDFIVCQIEDNQNILKLSCRPLCFTSYKAFLKNKKRSGTTLSAPIVCYPGFDVINFEINFIFLMKPRFLHGQKDKTKI